MKRLLKIAVAAMPWLIVAACGSRGANTQIDEPSWAPARQTASVGTVERHYIVSPQMDGDTIVVDVWLPEGYADSDSRHPVVYMHDGQNLFDAATTWNGQAWEMDSVVGRLVSAGEITAPVIVGVHSVSTTRLGDLMPQNAVDYITVEPDSALRAFLEFSPLRGNAYAAFIVETLKPQMDSLYRLTQSVDSTFVMGSSMGGLMSIYAMSEYPATFGGAGCLSTHWVGSVDGDPTFAEAMIAYLGDKLPRDGRHKLYLDHGTTSIDSLYGQWNERVVALADSLGYNVGAGNLAIFVDDGAGHEERYWAARVARPLKFFLSK